MHNLVCKTQRAHFSVHNFLSLVKSVVSDIKVPKRIRAAMNIESGLNDGMIFPLVVTVLAMITSSLTDGNTSDYHWFSYVLEQIIVGALVGAGIGYIGAKLSAISVNKNWMVDSYQNLIPIALAILSFYLAEYFHGNGFIAAFFAGLLVGNTSIKSREHIEDFAESEGELLVLISFFLFGLVFVPQMIDYVTIKVCLYALLSLTFVRMLPVMLSLLGSKLDEKRLDLSTITFIAWFGPRGIASILYVLIIAHEVGDISGFETVYATVMVTVFLSIIAHGLTAQLLANWYEKTHNIN